MKTFVNLLLFLSITACTVNISAQGRNSITGFVFGESRKPMSDTNVELLDDMYSIRGRIRTNGSGLYSFKGLENGEYHIKVLTGGTNYEEQTQSVSLRPVSVIRGSGAVSEQIDIYLKSKRIKNSVRLAPPNVVFVQDIPEEARKLYESGVTDLNNKNEKLGLVKLKQSIEAFPDYYMALDHLANKYLESGYYLPASILFMKAISVNPRSFTSHFGLGLATYRLNRIDESINYLKESVKINSSSINAHLWLGIAYQGKNNLSDALTSTLQANKLSSGIVPEIHFQLARIYKDQKKFDMAADELEICLKYTSDSKKSDEIKQAINTLRKKTE